MGPGPLKDPSPLLALPFPSGALSSSWAPSLSMLTTRLAGTCHPSPQGFCHPVHQGEHRGTKGLVIHSPEMDAHPQAEREHPCEPLGT